MVVQLNKWFTKNSYKRIPTSTNSYNHLWYLYNQKLFGSLISRGLKLRAHKKLCLLLAELKRSELIQPHFCVLISLMRITPIIRVKPIGPTGKYKAEQISMRSRITYGCKWVIKLLRESNKSRAVSARQIADLLSKSLRNKGPAIMKKRTMHRLAVINRRRPLLR